MSVKSPTFYFENDPKFSQEALDGLATKDPMPATFEWYQHVGLIVHFVACVSDESRAYALAHKRDWAVLRGLLNRCSRLMLANVALTHEGLFGDAAKIIDRCIFESALKARWLSRTREFQRYLAVSLRPEHLLKARVEADIAARGGNPLPIQERMLKSVDRHRRLAGVSWDQVTAAKKLPPINTMMNDLGFDEIVYLVSQQLGSHSVHGSWSSLLQDYLTCEDETNFELRDHDVEPAQAQYAAVILHVIDAAREVLTNAFDPDATAELVAHLGDRAENFQTFYRENHT